MTPRSWLVPLVLAAALDARAIGDSIFASVSGLPIAYGEGAVVHAGQILAAGGDPYAPVSQGFVSANYPPLAYLFVALGYGVGPFVGLRIANITAAVAVAAVIAWSARRDRMIGFTLGASFLATYPVALWLPMARVDLLAVALAFGAIVSLRSGRVTAFGVLGALAILAKPTAALPLAAVLVYLVRRDVRSASRDVVALAGASVVAALVLVLRFDAHGLYTHLVVYNALPYDVRNLSLIVLLGVLLLGAFVAVAFWYGDGLGRAYVVGALAVVVLIGHQGATVNYLLDVAAASCFALTSPRRTLGTRVPPLIAGQLFATLIVSTVGPFAVSAPTAAVSQVALLADLPKNASYYAEDSGLLIANGIAPVVDDAYVWARLVALGEQTDEVTPLVERKSFAAIVSEAPLETIAEAPEFRRERWPRRLVEAVLGNYRLDASVPGAYRYVPRP